MKRGQRRGCRIVAMSTLDATSSSSFVYAMVLDETTVVFIILWKMMMMMMMMMIVIILVVVVLVLAKVAAGRVGRAVGGIEQESNRRCRDCHHRSTCGLQVARTLLPRRHAR
jgi:hypothetical protein